MLEDVETREAMLATAAATGFHPSDVQLKAWRREGLIPKPVQQRGQGQGQGSTTVYPAGSGEQLVAFGRARQRDRQLHRIAFLLWWEGFPIDFEIVRAALLTELRAMEQTLKKFRDSDAISEEGWEILGRVQEEPRVPKSLRRARKRVGRSNLSTVMRILLDSAGGHPIGNDVPYEEESDSALVARAIGLPLLNQSLAVGGSEPIPDDDALMAVTKTGATANVTTLETLVAGISEPEAVSARTDLHAVAQLVSDMRFFAAHAARYVAEFTRSGTVSDIDPLAVLQMKGVASFVTDLLPPGDEPSVSQVMWLFCAGLGLWQNDEIRNRVQGIVTAGGGFREGRMLAHDVVSPAEERTSDGDCSHK